MGLTSQNPPSKRWANGKGYHKGLPVRNAIDKYGWENVTKEIVAENLTQDEASEIEMLLISIFQLTDLSHGYNLDSGGFSRVGYKFSEATKQKMRDRMKGKNQGEDNPFFGKKHSKESLKKMSKAQLGKHPSSEQHQHEIEAQRRLGTPCKCLETGEEYSSIVEASEATGIPYDHLKGVLKGDRKSTHGTHWIYTGKNDKKVFRPYVLKGPPDRRGMKNNKAKPLYCFELRKMYGCLKDAAEDVGVDVRQIVSVCNGKRETAAGYHWRYATEQERKELKQNDSVTES